MLTILKQYKSPYVSIITYETLDLEVQINPDEVSPEYATETLFNSLPEEYLLLGSDQQSAQIYDEYYDCIYTFKFWTPEYAAFEEGAKLTLYAEEPDEYDRENIEYYRDNW